MKLYECATCIIAFVIIIGCLAGSIAQNAPCQRRVRYVVYEADNRAELRRAEYRAYMRQTQPTAIWTPQ